MANGKIVLEIVTPERRLISENVDEVNGPGLWGQFGILPEHTPYLVQLDIGEFSYRKSSGRYFVSVNGGYAEVGSHTVTVLAETAELAEEIDAGRAEAARKRALDRLSGNDIVEKFDFDRAEVALKRAISRISVVSHSGL